MALLPPAVILAGGRASRLGGADKALLPFAGATLLDHVIASLRGQAGRIVLNAGGDPGRFARFGLPVIADSLPDQPGPLAGILAGLEDAIAQDEAATHLLSVPCDTPFLPRDLVSRLARGVGARTAIAVARSGGRSHHVIALWPLSIAADLREAITGEGLRRVEAFAARHAVIEIPFDDAGAFMNINTEAERLAAMRLAASHARPDRGRTAI